MPDQEDPLILAASPSSNFSLAKFSSRVTSREDYDYTDDNGAINREGTFDNDSEATSETSERGSVGDETDGIATDHSYREDTGGRSSSRVAGNFSDQSGTLPSHAESVAALGATIELDLPELGAAGPAKVRAVEPSPPIQSGPGHVITGTFAHRSSNQLLNITVEGQAKPIGVTDNHPIWSEDRQEFVEARQLEVGESLLTLAGPAAITSITPRGPPEPVYNLEIHGEHVYCVTDAGVLVHNEYPVRLYRGGYDTTARLGVDVKLGPDGLVHPVGPNGKPQGLSVNQNPRDKYVDMYRGAFPVNHIPEGLQAVQSGKPGHHVLAPARPMSLDEYQQQLNQVELGLVNQLIK